MNLTKGQSAKGGEQAIIPFVKRIVKERGFLSLYNGLGAGITRQVFYASSRFGLFEVIRDEVAKHRETDVFSRLFAGCTSGAMAAIISCPAEVTLVRMSNDANLPESERRNYKSVVDAARRILIEEGPGTFFSGAVPFAQRAMLVGAVQVGTYDQFKTTYRNLGISGFMNVFTASMSSGLLYSLVTMPFETAKNQLASQTKDPATGQFKYKGAFQTMGLIAKESGALKLWGGFLPYYMRCGGHTVTMFVAVEYLRALYSSMTQKQSV